MTLWESRLSSSSSSSWPAGDGLKLLQLRPLSRRTSFRYKWSCRKQEVLAVVGGGAAGIFGAIRAKSLCPSLDVLVLEKSQLLTKVKISGGGRCNVTTALFENPSALAGQYPRGHKELRGSFFRTHGPKDTAAWFRERGVYLKTEEDGRMFPASNSASTIIDCLLSEASKLGVVLQVRSSVSHVLSTSDSLFNVVINGTKVSSHSVEANYLLLATGSAPEGFLLAQELGHSIVDPRPSLFTFKVPDRQLQELAGTGPMLITHWGLSGPVILRLSAWAARDLFACDYQGLLWVDFEPRLNVDDVTQILTGQRKSAAKRKLGSFSPSEFSLVRRFWGYLLSRVDLDPDSLWAGLNNAAVRSLAALIKRCPFSLSGKGEFKDEFVTAGGISLIEVDLKTMESRVCPRLYLAGEILNVDGITGGFNFQNAWTGGFIAGTSIGTRSIEGLLPHDSLVHTKVGTSN